jgi:hypothetical protein
MPDSTGMARDFVAFCFERRPVAWPHLYDEMCNVAGRRLFRGMGYEELRAAGIDISLLGLPGLARVVQEVTAPDGQLSSALAS